MLELTAKARALRTIEKGTTAWEKTKQKLSGAVEVLMGIITKRNEKIRELQTEVDEMNFEITKTNNFITNTDKLYDSTDEVNDEV